MSYSEKMTTIYYFDQDKSYLLLGKPYEDPELEYFRGEEINDFILNHQKELQIPGVLSDEQVKQAVQNRGGYPPLQIIREKKMLSFLDTYEEIENLPHEVFREGF